jgi:rhodanese-related sulfurtransferase
VRAADLFHPRSLQSKSMSLDLLKFAQDNLLLLSVAAVSGGLLVWPTIKGSGGGASVTTLEAVQMINHEDAAVIDIRDAEAFAKGHVLNARNVPLADLDARLRDMEKLKRKPLIVCCDRGSRSGGAVAALRKAGHEKAVHLAGGLDAWREAGLPVEKG